MCVLYNRKYVACECERRVCIPVPRRPEGPSERASERRPSIYRYRKIDERDEQGGREGRARTTPPPSSSAQERKTAEKVRRGGGHISNTRRWLRKRWMSGNCPLVLSSFMTIMAPSLYRVGFLGSRKILLCFHWELRWLARELPNTLSSKPCN